MCVLYIMYVSNVKINIRYALVTVTREDPFMGAA